MALLETLSDRGYASRYKHLLKLDVRVNDRVVDTHRHSYRKRVTYLPTGDAILPPRSTLREALMFHARMSRMSDVSGSKMVSKILANLKLAGLEHRKIFQLSATEKARARVGIALMSRPAALLLDAPLFGLDVYEAYQMLAVLKQVASDLNIAILISADQPSSEVLFALDQVIFLSKGCAVFAGPPDGIVPYFAQLGYECPPAYSPSDFLLFLFEVVPAEEHYRLVASWQWHIGNSTAQLALPSVLEDSVQYPRWASALAEDQTSEISSVESVSDILQDDLGAADRADGQDALRPMTIPERSESPPTSPSNRGFFGEPNASSHRASWFKQFYLLYTRELVFLARSWYATAVGLLLFSVLSVMVALILFNMGSDAQAALLTPDQLSETEVDARVANYYGAIAVMVILALFGQVEGVSVTIPSIRLLYLAEHSFADFYGSAAFFLSQLLIELPLTFLNALIQVTAAYWIVGFQGSFVEWVGVVFATSVATSAVGWLISCTSKSPLTALQLVPVVFLPQLLFSGLLTDVQLIPPWLNWLEYMCYLKYCINIAFLIECKDYLDLAPNVPAAIEAIEVQNSINRDQIRLYVSIVVIITVACRLVAAVALYRFRVTHYLKL